MAAVVAGDERTQVRYWGPGRFQPGGVLASSHRAVATFLTGVGKDYAESVDEGKLKAVWLLKYRDDFRRIEREGPLAAYGLAKFLEWCPPDMPAYVLAIALMGRSGERTHNFGLQRLSADATPALRKHFARALRRMEAWPRLRRLAADYPNDRFVQAMLNRPYRQPFARRLARFAEHVDHSREEEAKLVSRMPLWFRDGDWVRTPAKNAGWIRTLLERIKRWVRGE